MTRPTFKYSLADLLLTVITFAGLMGGILTKEAAEGLYEKQKPLTSGRLYDLAWRIRAFMDQTQNEDYPDDLAAIFKNPKPDAADTVPAHTDPRFPELDTAYSTIAGLKRKDVGCIWLYENVPAELIDGRFVLLVQGEALVPLWLNEETFQRELRSTLSRPGVRTLVNDRKTWDWPTPDVQIANGRMTFSRVNPAGERVVSAEYLMNVRPFAGIAPWLIFGVALVAAVLMFLQPKFLCKRPRII